MSLTYAQLQAQITDLQADLAARNTTIAGKNSALASLQAEKDVSNAAAAEAMFELLMGSDVAPRKEFIANAEIDRDSIDA